MKAVKERNQAISCNTYNKSINFSGTLTILLWIPNLLVCCVEHPKLYVDCRGPYGAWLRTTALEDMSSRIYLQLDITCIERQSSVTALAIKDMKAPVLAWTN